MAYETTGVAVSKSQEQIRRLIYGHKGTGLMLLSQPPREGFEAMVSIANMPYHIRVMATCDKRKWQYSSGAAQKKKIDQENRRVWRVLFWHLKAMFEASDSGVIDARDVIMPYVVLRDGLTLADHIKPKMTELMNTDPSRLLSSGSV
jgi:hypothetical protein